MADDIRVNGRTYDSEDMTFREQREMRALIREHFAEEDQPFEELAMADILPAMVYVLARRDDPEFSLEQALDLKMKDVLIEEDAASKRPPTRRSSSPKK